MLYDRHYMRDAYPRRSTSLITWMICAMVAGFVIDTALTRLVPGGQRFDYLLEVSIPGLKSGFVWTLATYALLSANIWHLLGNALGVFFLGRALTAEMSEKRMLSLFLGGVVTGALFWTLTHFNYGGGPGYGGVLVGASAGVMAMLVTYACFHPDRPFTLLLFFVLPVTVKPKWVVAVLGGIDLFGFIFFELLQGEGMGGTAHSAHLGGMLAGWIYWRYLRTASWPAAETSSRSDVELPRWFRKSRQSPQPPPAFKVNLSDRDALKAEVDRILDKINSQGFGALTEEDRRTLDEARDLMSRR